MRQCFSLQVLSYCFDALVNFAFLWTLSKRDLRTCRVQRVYDQDRGHGLMCESMQD